MITIIDYGMGNLGSIANMIKKIGYPAMISNDRKILEAASKLILPGVGAFDRAMSNLNDLDLVNVIKSHAVDHKKPILGICLGMQLMCRSSEEGISNGLSLIEGDVKRFSFNEDTKLKIPHMGWNHIDKQKEHPLLENMPDEPRFYFVHSYHAVCDNDDDILTKTHHGYDFVSSFAKENIIGVQFHPEKSHKFGMNLLKNFIENL